MNTILGELGKNPKFCEYIKTIENKKNKTYPVKKLWLVSV